MKRFVLDKKKNGFSSPVEGRNEKASLFKVYSVALPKAMGFQIVGANK